MSRLAQSMTQKYTAQPAIASRLFAQTPLPAAAADRERELTFVGRC
jgi:hypothetical protein